MYNNKPHINISEENELIVGYEKIYNNINVNNIIVECYPGTNYNSLKKLFKKFQDYNIVNIEDALISKEEYKKLIDPFLGDDRVFGKMNDLSIIDFYDTKKLEVIQEQFNMGKTLVYGFGASLIKNHDVLLYIDIARWEIQQRYRNGMPNFNQDNNNAENIVKFKYGYFLDWRVADKIKIDLVYDYIIDANDIDCLKMLNYQKYKVALDKCVETPFRLVPYFDPGVWGGQWMKENCNLDPKEINYAWSFDGVVEENSVLLKFGNEYFETPGINILFNNPEKLLGDHVYNIYGCEFPIRFDFLDTMEGQNLSLQVHPMKEYIKEKFNMKYTQDESYYILDAKEGAEVYLGLKENIDKKDFEQNLIDASNGKCSFDDQKYINRFPAKKHDHFLIPAGTIHCSGSGTMVLEISSTPYIFTFKLWDWDRLGLDGRPRPIHIEHGLENIDFSRTTSWVKENLVSPVKKISDVEESTGLHEYEPIESRRFKTKSSISHKFLDRFQMINLVEGTKALIISPSNQFKTIELNYVETIIIPANIDEYEIHAINGEEITYIMAYIR